VAPTVRERLTERVPHDTDGDNGGSDDERSRLPAGVSRRRQLISAASAVVLLAGLTALLEWKRDEISLTIVFLLYLAAVVAVAAAGGPIVGVSVAIVAFLVVNFFFTEPLHTLDVSDPERLAELIIFLAISGTVAALVDTASRRRDVIEVRTAEAEQLSAANDLRTALLRAVSHDLRTPLTTAKMATSSLLASDVELNDAQRRELVHLADHEIDRLVAIVENLLDAGRLQAGVLTVDLTLVSLRPIVDHVIRGLPSDARARVDNDVDDDLVLVHTDPALLERVLANLVGNAITADSDHTVVVSAAATNDGRVAASVVDHGPGLSPDQRQLAFRPFHRFEDRGSSSGVGLGLPICAGFCEAMGAELVLDDTPGGGLTARVVLEVAA
jgi:two-component system, OmpR family, sensor histidine kinase KdpD